MPRDRLATEDRQNQALHMRRSGMQYADIARQLGYATHVGAYKAAMAALDRHPAEDAPVVRKLELDRLDELLQVAWNQLHMDHVMVSDGRVVKGDDGVPLVDHAGKMAALDRVIRIMERRTKFLGLDAPTRQTVTVITEDAVDAEIRRLEQELDHRSAAREDSAAEGASAP
jgi:hypothetical protein